MSHCPKLNVIGNDLTFYSRRIAYQFPDDEEQQLCEDSIYSSSCRAIGRSDAAE